MRIKATEMERMFHMSANGIKLYEKHGIIRPERSESSRYRVYGLDEMQAMGCGIQHRRYGFSMQETARLMGGATEEEQISAMERRCDELEAEIEALSRIRRSLRLNTRRAQQAQELLGRCIIEEKPAMYFLGSWRDEGKNSDTFDSRIGEWIDRYAPHLSAAILYDGAYFTQEGYTKPPLAGVAADAEIVLELGLLSGGDLTYLPPRKCLTTAFEMNRMPPDTAEISTRMQAYAKEMGVRLYAGGVMRLVQCVRKKDGTLGITALLWAPLEDAHEQIGSMK